MRRLDETTVDRLRRAPVTYEPLGPQGDVALPNGYRQLTRAVVLGSGRQSFDEAAAALMSWEMHLRAGLEVLAETGHVRLGAVAVLCLRFGPLSVNAPVRVVDVIAETRRRGFAYGTLNGHPESGVETFVVELGDDDAVTLTITAFSRPASRLARASGPVGRWLQWRITGRYLNALSEQ